MTEKDAKEQDETADDVPAEHPTDAADDKEKDEDAAVDETSEQSMDASDPPAW